MFFKRDIANVNGRLVWGLLLAALLWMPAAMASDTAARLLFVHGQVEVERDGTRRDARRGDAIYAGDWLHTGRSSSAQLRFTDDSVTALRAETSFQVTSYHYDAAEPAQGEQRTELLRGGLRSMTGAIGRARPEQVEYTTPVATMGIRGTELHIVHADEESTTREPGTYLFVESGRVAMSTDVAAVEVQAGEAFFVNDPQSAPQPFSGVFDDVFGDENDVTDEDEGGEEGSEERADEATDDTASDDEAAEDEVTAASTGAGTPSSAASAGAATSGTTVDTSDVITTVVEEQVTELTDVTGGTPAPGPDPEPEPTPEPDLTAKEVQIGLSPLAYVERSRDYATFELILLDNGHLVLTRAGGNGYTLTADSDNWLSYGWGTLGQRNQANYGLMAAGGYEIRDSDGELLSNEQPFAFIVADFVLPDLSLVTTTGNLVFELPFGTGVRFGDGSRAMLSREGRIVVNFDNGEMQLNLPFDLNDESEVERLLSGEGMLADFYESYIALTEQGDDTLVFDAKFYGTLTGNPEWGVDGLISGLYMLLDDGREGTGVYAFRACSTCDAQTAVDWGYWGAGSEIASAMPLPDGERLSAQSQQHWLNQAATPLQDFTQLGQVTYELNPNTGLLSGNESSLQLSAGSLNVDFANDQFDVLLQAEQGSLQAQLVAIQDLFSMSRVELAGSGVFADGALTGQFVGAEADAVRALIEAVLRDNDELVRGLGLFER